MFDHIVFGVSDYAASKAFFVQALAPLGVAVVSEGALGIELCRPNEDSSLCIRLVPVEKPSHLHLAFKAASRGKFRPSTLQHLRQEKDNGRPGLRPQYHANYLRCVCHRPGRLQHWSRLPAHLLRSVPRQSAAVGARPSLTLRARPNSSLASASTISIDAKSDAHRHSW